MSSKFILGEEISVEESFTRKHNLTVTFYLLKYQIIAYDV